MFLNFNAITVPAHLDDDNWSKAFEAWLADEVTFPTENARTAFGFMLSNYHYQKQQVRQISKELRAYFRKYHKQDYFLLRTIPGIGPLSAIAVISELGDINRFSNINKLSSYVGLLPLTSNSGETERVGGMSYRCNNYLRTILVEASWQAIRKDPACYCITRNMQPRETENELSLRWLPSYLTGSGMSSKTNRNM